MEAWMHAKEKALITKHFSREKTMLEWGSGGSTIEFSPFLKSYYSVEHVPEWHSKVSSEISRRGLKNINYYYIQQNEPRNPQQSQYNEFKDYIDVVDSFDTKFDIVLIDGRARRLCAYKIIPYLNPGAVVIIHDWVLRNAYHCVTDYYDVLEFVNDTSQTIATFTLKDTPNPNGYNLDLLGDERITENYFNSPTNTPIKTVGLFNL